jgi:hypothetical protein
MSTRYIRDMDRVASECPVIEACKKASLDAVLETWTVASVCPVIQTCRNACLHAVLEIWSEWRLYVQ